MAVYAAQVDIPDQNTGRILDALEQHEADLVQYCVIVIHNVILPAIINEFPRNILIFNIYHKKSGWSMSETFP